jgi:hypothetical protein
MNFADGALVRGGDAHSEPSGKSFFVIGGARRFGSVSLGILISMRTCQKC